MKSDFKPGRWGHEFKNGKLYEFTKTHVLVISAWPNPRAWLKRRSHGWKQTRKWADKTLSSWLVPESPPDYPAVVDALADIVGPTPEWAIKADQHSAAIMAAFLATIPEAVRSDLLRYSSRKWHLLNLHARCPGAADLSRSNPALAYALASNWVFHSPAVARPYRAARSLVNRKQKVILEWLGFPGTEPVRRILAKIEPFSLKVDRLLYLRDALRDPWVMKTLSHLDQINSNVLRLVTDTRIRQHVTPRLIEDFSRPPEDNPGEPASLTVFWDTLRMADRLGWRGYPARFASNRQLRAAHDELAVRLAEAPPSHWAPTRFPPPPFEGSARIMPLCTPDDLREEGRLMNHCVAVRAADVASGWMYVYRVMEPVRSTLAIVQVKDRWFCREMRGRGNAPIPGQVQKAVLAELLATPRMTVDALARFRREPEPIGGMPADPIDWDASENARRIAALTPEDERLFAKCLAVFGKPGVGAARSAETGEHLGTQQDRKTA